MLKRPLVVGLVFAFGWEQFALIMPGYVRRFTLMYYIQSLVPHAMPADGVQSLLQLLHPESPSTVDLPGRLWPGRSPSPWYWRDGWWKGENTSWTSRGRV